LQVAVGKCEAGDRCPGCVLQFYANGNDQDCLHGQAYAPVQQNSPVPAS
jgi:hypothetical protein